MNFKKLICYIKAIPYWFLTGNFIPHIFEEIERREGTIISTDTSFRESNSYQHTIEETVHKNCVIFVSECKFCGELDLSWYDKDQSDPYDITEDDFRK